MRKILFCSVIVFLLIVNGCSSQQLIPDKRGYIVKVGDKVNDFEVKLLDGSIKKISQFKAPVLVLNFFASWCIVCWKEIPHIEKEIWQPLKDKGIVIIGVNYKEKPLVAEKAVKEIGMTYPIALDENGKIFEKYARGGVTRNVVLDKNLNIIFLTRLFDEKEFDQMKSVIISYLNKSSKPENSDINEAQKMSQNVLQDLTGVNKKILLEYDGHHKIHLEGKIFSADNDTIEIGISLFDEDIVSKKYDKKTKYFRIGYRHYDGVRIAILPMTKFTIPTTAEKVIIFDYK